MGNLWIPDAADWLRAAGLEVVEYPGWLTRSRSSGGFDDILAIGLHHDASAIGRSGQRAADAHWRDHEFRPVGNFSLDRDGVWWVGAAGASNTQGKGGPYKCSRGTIPLDQGNRYTIAIEAANNGLGEPWPAHQQDSYARGIAALIVGLRDQGAYDAAARRHRPITLDPAVDPIAHFEWAPTRKIDPAGPSKWADTNDRYQRWRMDDFRSDVAAVVNRPPEPDPEEDEDMPARELIVRPPEATRFEMKQGKRVEAPWLYIWNGDVRYAIGADVKAGVTVVDETATRYGLLYEQVYGRQPVLVA